MTEDLRKKIEIYTRNRFPNELLENSIKRFGIFRKWLVDKTAAGGYGELHYNGKDGNDEIDFHRFVLYFGHGGLFYRFNRRIVFNTGF